MAKTERRYKIAQEHCRKLDMIRAEIKRITRERPELVEYFTVSRCLNCAYCRRTSQPNIIVCLNLVPRMPEAAQYARCCVDLRVVDGCIEFLARKEKK